MTKILPLLPAIVAIIRNTFGPIGDTFPSIASKEGNVAAHSVLAFWAVALLLIVVPGADWAFTISAGMRGRSVLAAVGGLVIGYAAVTLVIAAGVGALVASSPAALTGLCVLGGVYLMWQGTVAL